MSDDSDAPDDLEARLDRLESTLEELRDEVMADERIERGRRAIEPAAETALRLTERLAVPAAVAALEANVRALEFVQDRLRELEGREGRAGDGPTPARVSERMLDRLDDALGRMEDAIADSDLPQNAEARRLLERARELNADVRDRVQSAGPDPADQDVVTIDVEEELDQIRDDVDAEDDEE
jgi:hypothetical protein